MKLFERFSAIAGTIAILGPANVASLLLAACLSVFLFAYRLATQGYCRCFISTK